MPLPSTSMKVLCTICTQKQNPISTVNLAFNSQTMWGRAWFLCFLVQTSHPAGQWQSPQKTSLFCHFRTAILPLQIREPCETWLSEGTSTSSTLGSLELKKRGIRHWYANKLCFQLPTIINRPKPSRRLASTSIWALEASATAAFQDDLKTLKGSSKEVVNEPPMTEADSVEIDPSRDRIHPFIFPLPFPLPPLPFRTSKFDSKLEDSLAQDLKPPAQSSVPEMLHELSRRSLSTSRPIRLHRLADGASMVRGGFGGSVGRSTRRLLGGG